MPEEPAITDGPDTDAPDTVGWPIRAGVLVVIGAILVFGVLAVEAWPFTGWRLYSNTKGPTAGSYFAFRVAPDGSEHRVDYPRLPDAYSRVPYLLEKFDRFSASEQDALCRAIAQAERDQGRPTTAITIYRERYQVAIVDGERRKRRIEREFRTSCAEERGA
jgi:hypothetical protein